MPNLTALEKRLEELEAAMSANADRTAAIEGRLDAIRDELQRAATLVYRIKLGQEADKAQAQSQTEALQAIRSRLERIHKLIGDA